MDLTSRLTWPSRQKEVEMPYAKHTKNEPELDFIVLKEHVRDAKCASTTECVLALAGVDNIGVVCTVSYDLRVHKVDIVWQVPDDAYPGAMRIHNGYLDPSDEAIALFLLNDVGKRRLVRNFPDEGQQLKIVNHRSRVRQVRTEEERAIETARRLELKEKRAAGLLPPATPRPRTNPAVPRIALKQTFRFIPKNIAS